MALKSQFSWADYTVFAVTVTASFTIGILASFCGGKKGTISDYLLGSRSLSIFPVAMSLVATSITSQDLLGLTAEMYYFGTQMMVEILGRALAYPIPLLLVVPVLYPLKLTSVFEVGTH